MNETTTEPATAEKDYDTAELAALVRRGVSYAAVHRTCGHVLGVPTDRREAQALVDAAPAGIRFQFRVRVATADDLIASLRGTRCALCTTDGRITASAAR